MNTRNSTNVVWIDTTMHRCAAMEEDTSYPLSSFPPPSDERTPEDDAFRAAFWQSFTVSVLLVAVCSFLLAVWPNC